jgi:hypothetical protein
MPAESNGTVERSYTILEERSVADFLRDAADEMPEQVTLSDLIDHFATHTVFVELGALQARNADHAYRLTYKARFGEGDGHMRVAAVSTKTWKVKPLSSNVRRNIKVG